MNNTAEPKKTATGVLPERSAANIAAARNHGLPVEGLPERLQGLLREHGSVNKVSKALGVTHVALTQWKTGKSQPTVDKLLKLAEYFGVSCDYLLGRTRTAAPDDFIEEVQRRYGISEETLAYFEEYGGDEALRDIADKMQKRKEEMEKRAQTMRETTEALGEIVADVALMMGDIRISRLQNSSRGKGAN